MDLSFGISSQAVFGQLLLGLINGSFYALLSLGLAVIFGLLRIINFSHGALYMLGAFCAYLLSDRLGVDYWLLLFFTAFIVFILGVFIERVFLSHLYGLDPLYSLLFTFGLALVIEGIFRFWFGSSGKPFATPNLLAGGLDLGFMFLPLYRGWVVGASLLICVATWALIEKTRLGSYLRAATENQMLVQALGVNARLLFTMTYGAGAALAAVAGVLAAPIYQVSPLMGSNIVIVVFAVVVIGGMGSITGSIITGYALGIIEGLTKVIYPEAANIAVFIMMIAVLLIQPSGLFGKEV